MIKKEITVGWIGFPVKLQNVKMRMILGEECIDINHSLVEGRIYRYLLGRKAWSKKEAHFVRHYKLMSEDQFEVFLKQLETVIYPLKENDDIVIKFCDGF
jgi:hypothetical protein